MVHQLLSSKSQEIPSSDPRKGQPLGAVLRLRLGWGNLAFNESNKIHIKGNVEYVPRCDILLIVGSQSHIVKQTKAMYKMLKGQDRASMITIDKVGDVLTESPSKVAEAILFFCQVGS